MGQYDRQATLDELQFVLQSDNRVTILAELADGGQLDRYALESHIDASRRTILRTLNRLDDRAYVIEREDGYELTAFGRRVYDRYEAWASDVAFADGFQRFLKAVPCDVLAFDLDRLRDARVTSASGSRPFAVLDRFLTIREAATEIRELAPLVERRSVTQIADRIEAGDAFSMEAVVTEDAVERASRNEALRDAQQTVADSEVVDLYVYRQPLPLAVAILDDVVAMIAPQQIHESVLIETDDPEIREWAETFYDRHRAEALPVTP